MNTVIVVITSILIYSMVSPLIDKILQTINSYFDVMISKNSLRIVKINKEINSLSKPIENNEPVITKVLGFSSDKNEEE